MVPPNTDRLIFSKLNEVAGEYLPKIAGATEGERMKLLCEVATQLFDVWTKRRETIFKSQDDLPAFKSELETHLSRVVMPFLAPVRLSEAELDAIQLALAGRAQHWLGVVVARTAPTAIVPAGPSGTSTDQSTAVPVATPAAAQVDKDRIKKERRQLVDAYIAECRQAGIKITRVDIWKEAGYKNRSEFERWERNDPRATFTAAKRITRVLTDKPHLKKRPPS